MNYRNLSVTFLMLATLITIIADLRSGDGQINLENLLAISVILGFSLMVPLWGFVLSVPVFLLVYIRNYECLGELWGEIKNRKVKIGG